MHEKNKQNVIRKYSTTWYQKKYKINKNYVFIKYLIIIYI